jgi:hypothetical protein
MSPAFGSSPLAGAAPHDPRTSAFAPTTERKSGAFSFTPAPPFSTTFQTWITGTPAARAAVASALTFGMSPCFFA